MPPKRRQSRYDASAGTLSRLVLGGEDGAFVTRLVNGGRRKSEVRPLTAETAVEPEQHRRLCKAVDVAQRRQARHSRKHVAPASEGKLQEFLLRPPPQATPAARPALDAATPWALSVESRQTSVQTPRSGLRRAASSRASSMLFSASLPADESSRSAATPRGGVAASPSPVIPQLQPQHSDSRGLKPVLGVGQSESNDLATMMPTRVNQVAGARSEASAAATPRCHGVRCYSAMSKRDAPFDTGANTVSYDPVYASATISRSAQRVHRQPSSAENEAPPRAKSEARNRTGARMWAVMHGSSPASRNDDKITVAPAVPLNAQRPTRYQSEPRADSVPTRRAKSAGPSRHGTLNLFASE